MPDASNILALAQNRPPIHTNTHNHKITVIIFSGIEKFIHIVYTKPRLFFHNHEKFKRRKAYVC